MILHLKPPLLLLILISATATAQQFKEAPKFQNSPSCPPSSTTTSTIHIAMTLDTTYLRGSLAAIHSILQHSSCPQNIFFHFISSNSTTHPSTLSTSFPYLKFQIYPFHHHFLPGLISTSIRPALDSPLNYARSYLPHLLPRHLTKLIYLDSDIILVHDITRLHDTPFLPDTVLAAPEYCNANFTSYFTPTFWSNPSLFSTFSNRKRKPCYFNTGVMVIDLQKWREGGYTKKIEEWMELQKRMRIYELGSLPPFLLVFGGDITPVDHRWNQHGLGGDNFRGLCRDLHPGPVSLLHWSGKGKPWVRIDAGRPCPVDAIWAPYDLLKVGHHTFGFDS